MPMPTVQCLCTVLAAALAFAAGEEAAPGTAAAGLGDSGMRKCHGPSLGTAQTQPVF